VRYDAGLHLPAGGMARGLAHGGYACAWRTARAAQQISNVLPAPAASACCMPAFLLAFDAGALRDAHLRLPLLYAAPLLFCPTLPALAGCILAAKRCKALAAKRRRADEQRRAAAFWMQAGGMLRDGPGGCG